MQRRETSKNTAPKVAHPSGTNWLAMETCEMCGWYVGIHRSVMARVRV